MFVISKKKTIPRAMEIKIYSLAYGFFAVLRIHDILVRIRIWIRGSMPLTNGSRSGSLTFKMPTKTNLKKSFPAYYFLKVLLHHFSKIKSQKRSHKIVETKAFLTKFA